MLTGLSVGGPLVRDKLFFFGAYEGNYQNRQGVTRFQGDPAIWPSNVAALQGEAHTSPFRSSLGFGKLSYNQSEKQVFELTGNVRIETDKRRFGGQFGDVQRAFEAGENLRNNVVDGGLKHTFFGREWINEALVSFQWYQFNPQPFDFTTVGQDYAGIGRIGGADSRQDLTQRRLSFRDDWTYAGLQAGGSHVIKIGANFDFLKYKLNKQLNENPVFSFNSDNNFAFPVQAQLGFGDPEIDGNNNQLGIYAQDDWSPTDRLTINAGIRWDYETGMYNKDLRDSGSLDRYADPASEPAVHRHRPHALLHRRQSTARPTPARFSPGSASAMRLTGARRPFSSRRAASSTTGSASTRSSTRPTGANTPICSSTSVATRRAGEIAWDPKYFSRQGLLDLVASGFSPPQEVFLVPNDLKPPKSYQFSGGLRHQFGTVLTSVSYSGIRGRNGFSYEWANVALNPAVNDCCISVATPYQNILVGNNTRADLVRWRRGADRSLLSEEQRELRVGRRHRVHAFLGRRRRRRSLQLPDDHCQLQRQAPDRRRSAAPDRGELGDRCSVRLRHSVQRSCDPRLGQAIQESFGSPPARPISASFWDTIGRPGSRTSICGCAKTSRISAALTSASPAISSTSSTPRTLAASTRRLSRATERRTPISARGGCTISDPRRFQLGFQYDF